MADEGNDVAYLWDMLEAAKTILRFTRDVTLEQYRNDLMLRLAVEREIEVIGEAARLVNRSETPMPKFRGGRSLPRETS